MDTTEATAALLPFRRDDGGREAAGFKGRAGDCVCRAIAIATGKPYLEIYNRLSTGCRTQRKTKRSREQSSCRDGVNVSRKWFKDLMQEWGFQWRPCMAIGRGCEVHLRAGEIPSTGRLVVALSRHYCAVIDGEIRDMGNPDRGGMRCVYGYWELKQEGPQP